MHLTTIDEIKDYGNIFIDNTIENSEILNLIEQNINCEERTIYLKLKDGNKVNKADMLKLITKLQEIILEHG